MRWLDEEVLAYTATDAYPFHMPGAKRQNVNLLEDPFRYDITEIPGFDDLRRADGLLRELEDEWALVYGAGRAYLSVNGSTCGNLSVIFAALSEGERILVADGAHWSVYNAAKLRHLSVVSLSVEADSSGVLLAPTPLSVERALSLNEGIRAVFITSPSYEGMVADVKAIAELVHEKGALLLVDCAHGAHFGLPIWGQPAESFGSRIGFDNPVNTGADAVVVSLHKTLPVLGQTAMILLPENDLRVKAEKVKKYLNMFQTSSPSYLLMSSVSSGLRLLEQKGALLAGRFSEYLSEFYKKTGELKKLNIIQKDNQDLSKIVISTRNAGISGYQLMERLRAMYGLWLERAGDYYCLALCTMMDSKEGLKRLILALKEIDEGITYGYQDK